MSSDVRELAGAQGVMVGGLSVVSGPRAEETRLLGSDITMGIVVFKLVTSTPRYPLSFFFFDPV